ncbi:hypothetical protein EJB05_27086, partial [Eragrostis curvula]
MAPGRGRGDAVPPPCRGSWARPGRRKCRESAAEAPRDLAGRRRLPRAARQPSLMSLPSSASSRRSGCPSCPLPSRIPAILDHIRDAVFKKTFPTSIELVDIAGLVKGASKGEGLGNQFLSMSQQTVPTSIELVDIAGLANGASKGEGL